MRTSRHPARAFAGLLFATLPLLAAPAPAQAQERILSYASNIAVQRDGSLDVT